MPWTWDEAGTYRVLVKGYSRWTRGPFELLGLCEGAGCPGASEPSLGAEGDDCSAELACASDEEPRVLRAKVTSPRGTTEAAIQVLDEAGVDQRLEAAVAAGIVRGRALRESTS